MNRINIYIAGALNAQAPQYIKNMNNMIYFALEVKKLCNKLGWFPSMFVPCLDIQLGMTAGDWEYEDYFNNSQGWLENSDIVMVTPGWENSNGTKKEIEIAESYDICVLYTLRELEDKLKKYGLQ